jgi:chromosome segregation ATPase
MNTVILNAQGLREEYNSPDDAIMKLSKEIISLKKENEQIGDLHTLAIEAGQSWQGKAFKLEKEIKRLDAALKIAIEKNIELQKENKELYTRLTKANNEIDELRKAAWNKNDELRMAK